MLNKVSASTWFLNCSGQSSHKLVSIAGASARNIQIIDRRSLSPNAFPSRSRPNKPVPLLTSIGCNPLAKTCCIAQWRGETGSLASAWLIRSFEQAGSTLGSLAFCSFASSLATAIATSLSRADFPGAVAFLEGAALRFALVVTSA